MVDLPLIRMYICVCVYKGGDVYLPSNEEIHNADKKDGIHYEPIH